MTTRSDQLSLFPDVPLPAPASPVDAAPVPPRVPAPLAELAALDRELDARGPNLSPAWPDQPSPPARICTAPILERGRAALARRALVDEQIADIVGAAKLDAEERAAVRRLEAHTLEDDRSWLEVLLDACRAELLDGEGNDVLAQILKWSLRRGRPLGRGMLARSRFFYTLRQITNPTASYPTIRIAWGCRDHSVVMYGVENHELRLVREAGLGEALAASRPAPPAAPPPAPPSAERWVERDPDDSVDELVVTPARVG